MAPKYFGNCLFPYRQTHPVNFIKIGDLSASTFETPAWNDPFIYIYMEEWEQRIKLNNTEQQRKRERERERERNAAEPSPD